MRCASPKSPAHAECRSVAEFINEDKLGVKTDPPPKVRLTRVVDPHGYLAKLGLEELQAYGAGKVLIWIPVFV